ncbi:isoleucine--tRNA ligase [Gammaproteobacteria bacterium]
MYPAREDSPIATRLPKQRILSPSMADYKNTLNLPRTDFPMKANLAEREPLRLRHWEAIDLYRRMRAVGEGRPKFILHDGPPYANGSIHLGHAVNKVLKDIIVKAKTLSGYDAPYVPGWDCHGLPIELQVEKEVGKPGGKVTPRQFRDACRRYAAKQVATQSRDFQRLGVLGDWVTPYLTMDFRVEADILRSLGRIIAAGHVHAGFKPVHWCADCRSALAEAEVEYQDRTSPAIDVRFSVVDEAAFLARFQGGTEAQEGGSLAVVIWTTTPWTLPANQAVALHPDLDYVVALTNSHDGPERIVVAEALLDQVMARYGREHYTVLARTTGAALEGLPLRHPFYAREVPIILGEHVTIDAGTGAVHTAPGHGQEDYAVGLRYGLPVHNPVGGHGRFLPDTEIFAGEPVFEANAHVLAVLHERGMLLHNETIRHSYPHCWRHKTPILFRATPQWFIGMEQGGLRRQALSAIQQVSWHPDWGEARIVGMVDNRPDWCISRQRTWGVPLALFVHKSTGALHSRTQELIEEVAQRIEKEGVDAWFELDPTELLGAEAEDYHKLHDTLDVWFDSGVTHAAVLERREGLTVPADLYLEGSDQHRGWFQSSLLTGVAMRGEAPYRGVLTHGFTVDEQGRKMAKSLGNVVDPQQVVGSLGADILRLWVASTDYRGEMSISNEVLKRMADSYRRIRNTARFLLANLSDFDPRRDLLPVSEMLSLDRWIVERAFQLQDEVRVAYDSYQFHLIYQKVHNFCAVDLGAQYLDIIKDRQYTTQAASRPRRSAQSAVYHIAEALARWLAPILSFTADEIWHYLPGDRPDSVFLTTWYPRPVSFHKTTDAGLDLTGWEQVFAVREAVAKALEGLRTAGAIGSSLDAEVMLWCEGEIRETLHRLGDELRFVFITSAATLAPAMERPADALEAGTGLWLKAMPSPHPKCGRCWHHRIDVGAHASHPELCGRCVTNIEGPGEERRHA